MKVQLFELARLKGEMNVAANPYRQTQAVYISRPTPQSPRRGQKKKIGYLERFRFALVT